MVSLCQVAGKQEYTPREAAHFIGNMSFKLTLNAFDGFEGLPAASLATANR